MGCGAHSGLSRVVGGANRHRRYIVWQRSTNGQMGGRKNTLTSGSPPGSNYAWTAATVLYSHQKGGGGWAVPAGTSLPKKAIRTSVGLATLSPAATVEVRSQLPRGAAKRSMSLAWSTRESLSLGRRRPHGRQNRERSAFCGLHSCGGFSTGAIN